MDDGPSAQHMQCVSYLGMIATGAAYALVNQLQLDGETAVMAHRGASAAAPENTLAAIQGAIDAGAQYVEIDVQETADGEIVVIHDSDLKKVGGVPLVVGESTLQQLGYTDIGSWFDLSFSDQRIPTLREVLVRAVPFLGGFGGRVFAEDGVTPTLDTEAMVNALTFMHDLKYDLGVMPAEADYNVADGLFKQGDAAMIVNGGISNTQARKRGTTR